MTLGEGAFCASLDADSEGEEGKFYVWSLAEVEGVLGKDDAALFAARYDVTHAGKVVGRVGGSARHHELGPIALALVKRNVPTDVDLDAGGLVAAQEVVVDPEIGLHVRPHLR